VASGGEATDGTADRVRAHVTRAAGTVFSRAAVPLWIAGAAIVAVLIGFVGFGGLTTATPQVRVVPAGEEARTSLYAVTVLGAELTDEVEGQYLEAEPGETLLVVTLRLENLSDRAVGIEGTVDRVSSRLLSASAPLLVPSDVAVTGSARSWRVDGSLRAVVLQPGVPADVRIAWPIAGGTDPTDGAHLDVYDARAQSGQVILSASAVTWRRTDVGARIPLEIAP
jgi:hypothetical protein